ncbi:hypothetical protein [Streptomyces sp. 1222.5]|uniref:hypothetical protein n=1 Tax=Streptomyces sp. 1222.5 TaxID=1881026 RepID=UPI003EBE7095
MILEFVVGEFTGEPELLDLLPVAPAAVDSQGRRVHGGAGTLVVPGFHDSVDLVLAPLDVGSDRVRGDDGGVLVGDVDDVHIAAAIVVLGVGQPVDEGLGRDVETASAKAYCPQWVAVSWLSWAWQCLACTTKVGGGG